MNGRRQQRLQTLAPFFSRGWVSLQVLVGPRAEEFATTDSRGIFPHDCRRAADHANSFAPVIKSACVRHGRRTGIARCRQWSARSNRRQRMLGGSDRCDHRDRESDKGPKQMEFAVPELLHDFHDFHDFRGGHSLTDSSDATSPVVPA